MGALFDELQKRLESPPMTVFDLTWALEKYEELLEPGDLVTATLQSDGSGYLAISGEIFLQFKEVEEAVDYLTSAVRNS